jgi:ribosomal protein S18 acetylase RimI-like enzyme
MTKEEFAAAYLAAQGWDRPVVLDDNLAMEYPVCVYEFSDRNIVALTPELEAAVEAVDPNAGLVKTLDLLFDLSQVRVKKLERVTGFYAHDPWIGEALPSIESEEDIDALLALMATLDEEEALLGEVTPEDDFTCCIMERGRMLAAAGAVLTGKMADLSVCVRPDCRGRGLGARVTSALIRKVQRAGCVALYRVQQDNLPSLRLAQRLGLLRGFNMEGALLEFPDEDAL